MINSAKILMCIGITFLCCGQAGNPPITFVTQDIQSPDTLPRINDTGTTVETRFIPPAGFERMAVDENSFENYLRNLPLKPVGSKVKYFNGTIKQEPVYDAVINMDIGNKDLQQCADAVMRLRGEYLYSQEKYDEIAFNFTNGFNVEYTEWIKGNRIAVTGNKTFWRKSAEASNTYNDFKNYMDLIYTYSGSLSLSKSLKHREIRDISIGDVFIWGGSPGHAVIVVDIAENKSGDKVFLLAQSYMPAQETQILKNLNDANLSPWYSSGITGELITPQWTFSADQLKTW